ncbi:hypothetical protein BV898_07145 [Hypsibius exemplaris]|uniref:Ku70/Ku80 N-terminal alpha/beta domain-containing protein n=1 Tax=Hypsibius exemplaris TaxID=2072580 RepID=A0A1W0WUL4_HYPEX|nr:hypothetical protein BV898_07145 [Hypsibius exemplaris]
MSDEAMDFGGGGGDSDAQSGGSFEWSVPQDELDFYEADLQGAGRDAVIFAIDFSPMMFQQCNPKQEGKKVQSALKTTIEAVREAVISRIYRSEQDFLSIVLYNTFNRSVDIAVDHVNVVDPLQRPGVEVVKKLDKLLEMDADELQAKFGSVDKCAIGDILLKFRNYN